MSFERAWGWLMARPGVILAVLIIIAGIVYMVMTRKNRDT
jgi:hypothetical protein